MTSPIGYNNPAYSHQFDSSLYDYQYVPEIDPDFEGQSERPQEQIHLVHPDFRDEFSGASEEFDASDESNQSIIVEECNNRRVTLICEKRSKTEDKVYEDRNCRGAYHHDISLESENDYRASREEGELEEGVSQRHQRKLETPLETNGNFVNGYLNGYDGRSGRSQGMVTANSVHFQANHRPQRQHRYEEIGAGDEYMDDANVSRGQHVSRHRYAEITIDENGYPSIGNEIEVERDEIGYRIVNTDSQREYAPKPVPKPRAPSPISQSFSPTFSPSKTYQRTTSPRPPNAEVAAPRIAPTRAAPIPGRRVPQSAIEMAELSPPNGARAKPNQTPFFQSPKRQPPIGASAPADLHEQMKVVAKNGKTGRPTHKRHNSVSVTPSKPGIKGSVTQMFQVKTTPKNGKTFAGKGEERSSSRRNISQAFADPGKEFAPGADLTSRLSSPYRPTTMEVAKAKTAVITPILQRKSKRSEAGYAEDVDNFRKTSHMFQSTGNLYKGGLPAEGGEYPQDVSRGVADTKARIKRNRSVPNFAQSLASEGRFKHAGGNEYHGLNRSVRKLEYQYSPTKSMDKFSPINRSRMSLIDQTKLSWSNSVSDFQTGNSGCLIVGAVVQIITSLASCAICFYLFSKLGRRYYLDFGILAGFVNFVLGVLGFRSHCWRWLPNRNYVSGYILLTAFSILTCAGFVYLITARPMSGDPALDLIGGGICGVSVLTIILSVTGLTMSGCCKTPPPDNRVNNI